MVPAVFKPGKKPALSALAGMVEVGAVNGI